MIMISLVRNSKDLNQIQNSKIVLKRVKYQEKILQISILINPKQIPLLLGMGNTFLM